MPRRRPRPSPRRRRRRPTSSASPASAGWTSGSPGCSSRTDPVDALGVQPELAAAMFALKEGERQRAAARRPGLGRSATVSGPPGCLRARPRRSEGPRPRRRRPRQGRGAGQAARRRHRAPSLKTAKDFAATAKKHSLEVKPTELLARGAAIPDIGMSEEVDAAAFSLPVNGVSDPISTPTRHRHHPRPRAAGSHRRADRRPGATSCAKR